MFLLTMPHCLAIIVSLTVWQEGDAAPSQTSSLIIMCVCEHSLSMAMKQLVSLNVTQDVSMLVEHT